jgi:hypothetical protein
MISFVEFFLGDYPLPFHSMDAFAGTSVLMGQRPRGKYSHNIYVAGLELSSNPADGAFTRYYHY